MLAVAMMFAAISAMLPVMLIPGLGTALEAWPLPGQAVVQVVLTGLVTLAALALVALAMRFVDRRPLADVGWRWTKRALPALMIGLGAAIVTTLGVALAVEASGLTRPVDPAQFTGGAPVWLVIPVALATAFLLQGIPEELIWRGYVLQTLPISPVAAIYVSATVFAALHVVSSGGQQSWWEHLVYLAVPFGFSLLASGLLLHTGSLWAAVGVHGGLHVALAIGVLWLSIGEGPWLWASIGLVQSLLGAWLIRRAT